MQKELHRHLLEDIVKDYRPIMAVHEDMAARARL